MNSQTYTNAILSLIAGLLCFIAWQQYEQRPVTVRDIRELSAQGDADRLQQMKYRLPLVHVHGGTIDVEVQSPITISDVESPITISNVESPITVNDVLDTVTVRIEH